MATFGDYFLSSFQQAVPVGSSAFQARQERALRREAIEGLNALRAIRGEKLQQDIDFAAETQDERLEAINLGLEEQRVGITGARAEQERAATLFPTQVEAAEVGVAGQRLANEARALQNEGFVGIAGPGGQEAQIQIGDLLRNQYLQGRLALGQARLDAQTQEPDQALQEQFASFATQALSAPAVEPGAFISERPYLAETGLTGVAKFLGLETPKAERFQQTREAAPAKASALVAQIAGQAGKIPGMAPQLRTAVQQRLGPRQMLRIQRTYRTIEASNLIPDETKAALLPALDKAYAQYNPQGLRFSEARAQQAAQAAQEEEE